MKTLLLRPNRILIFITFLLFTGQVFAKKNRVLVFAKTTGFRHGAAIAAGKKAIMDLGLQNKFLVDTTEDASIFTADKLKNYNAVIFLCTTGDVLNDEQQTIFEKYINKGGGFVGIHSAADTEYDWPWYGELNGAYFKSHPSQQEAVYNIVDASHPATAPLPLVWKHFDEMYNFKWIGLDLNFLITIDENSYSGGENGSFHPMAWYHNFAGGRAFYTALGHDKPSYEEPLYLKHLLGGIEYAMGKHKIVK